MKHSFYWPGVILSARCGGLSNTNTARQSRLLCKEVKLDGVTIALIVVMSICCLASAGETNQSGEVQQYLSMLNDPKSDVRREAISGLRKLSARIHRMGESRMVRPSDFSPEEAEKLVGRQIGTGDAKSMKTTAERDARIGRRMPLAGGPDFAPKVEGLVPHLIKAASDDEESNRILALYALADTRDPLAQVELRNRLQDPGERVRFEAACLLAEFRDVSGLSELKAALQRLQTNAQDEWRAPLYYTHVGRLLYSFERITGKSMSEIPPDPHLVSDSRKWPQIRERYVSLLRDWAAWWAWQPDVKKD